MNYTPEIIASALFSLSPDCSRQEWVKLLMAVKSELGENGRELAIQWSSQSNKFNQRDFDATWRSISPGGSITIGSLIHLAKAACWKSDARISYSPSKRQPAPPTKSKTLPHGLKLWESGSYSDELVSTHQYAGKKGVYWAAGARRGPASGSLIGSNADCVLVPMRDLNGTFRGVECINPDGIKQTFGNKGVLILGNDLAQNLPQLIVEGWATAARTLHIFRGNVAVYACFGKGKMKQTALELEIKYPNRKVIILEEQDA